MNAQFSEYRPETVELFGAFALDTADQFTWSARRRDELCAEISRQISVGQLNWLLDSLADDALLLTPTDAATVAAFAGRHAWALRYQTGRTLPLAA